MGDGVKDQGVERGMMSKKEEEAKWRFPFSLAGYNGVVKELDKVIYRTADVSCSLGAADRGAFW